MYLKKLILIFGIIVAGALVLLYFIPQEQRPSILRCSGCWYGKDYICADRFTQGGIPANSDGTCHRNFMM